MLADCCEARGLWRPHVLGHIGCLLGSYMSGVDTASIKRERTDCIYLMISSRVRLRVTSARSCRTGSIPQALFIAWTRTTRIIA